jgi:hypothetical protein
MISTGIILRHSLIDKNILRYEWIKKTNGEEVLLLGNYAYRIRGTDKNNIALAGDASMIWHFNGMRWKKFHEIYNTNHPLSFCEANKMFTIVKSKILLIVL